MKTPTPALSKPTPPPAPEARRPARRPERPGFRPDMQRLEPRISLSSFGMTAGVTQGVGFGLTSNHNETLAVSRPPRGDRQRGRTGRRTLAPAVEGLERRVSLSGLTLGCGLAHGVGLVQSYGSTLNHNETLVYPRPPRKRTEARRQDRRGRTPVVEGLEHRISLSGLDPTIPRPEGGSSLVSSASTVMRKPDDTISAVQPKIG